MTSSAADGVSPETARELEAALVKYLAESGRPGTRKKAATCLASLGATAGDGFLARCASAARREIAEAATRSAAERDALAAPYAQLLGAIAHAAGSRFGTHAFESLPCVVSLLASAKEEGSESTRETCLRTLERFAEECPRATAAALPAVVAESLRLVSHDPLYGEEGGDDDHVDLDEEKHMDADEHMDDDDDGSEYGSEYDASEYSDDGDDDASWKIRRGAARVLRAVSAKAPFALEKSASDSETNDDENKSDTTGGGGLFVALVRKLIVRGSRERDESCRLEVFAALEAALRAASRVRRLGVARRRRGVRRAGRRAERGAVVLRCHDRQGQGARGQADVQDAHGGVRRAPRARGVRPRRVRVRHVRRRGRGVRRGVGEHERRAHRRSGRRLRARRRGAAGSPSCASPRRGWRERGGSSAASVGKKEAVRLCRTLAPPLAAATRDAYYKTAAEALIACEALVPAFAAAIGSPDASVEDGAFLTRAATNLVAAAAEGVGAADRDAEVKAAATRCAGAACARLGVFLDLESVSTAVEGLVDRLSNEATRVGAARLWRLSSRLPKPTRALSRHPRRAPRAPDALPAQADRATRHASLEALGALVERRSDTSEYLSDALVAEVVTNAAACAADAGPAAAATALFLASAALRRAGRSGVRAGVAVGRPPRRARARQAPPRRRSSEELPGRAPPRTRGFRASATRRVRFGRAPRVLRRSRLAGRLAGHEVRPRGGHGASLRGDANGDGRDGARRPRERFELRRRRRRRGRVRGGGVRVAGSAVAECAASLVRELESEATQNATNASKINAHATPRSGRSRLAMYCLGELARLPPSAGRASALGDAGVAASFETLARDAFETRSEKKSGKESHAQTHAKHGDESFVTPAAFALGGACAGLECRAFAFVVAGVADAPTRAPNTRFSSRRAKPSSRRREMISRMGFSPLPRLTLVPTTLNRLKQSRRRRSSPAPRLRPSWRRCSPPPSARRRRARAPSSRSASGDSPLAKRSTSTTTTPPKTKTRKRV